MRGKWFSMKLAVRQALLGLIWLGLINCESSLLAAEPYILPVPNIVIYPGDVIKDNCLVDRDFSADFSTRNSAVIDSRAALVGKVARRTLLPGSPISLSVVGDPRAVANGAKVRLLYENGALAITAYGTALQAGSVGEIISVRNLGSGLTVSGTVQADGSVRVGGG
jgi:flagella basal body P-ring formation protein FlgA